MCCAPRSASARGAARVVRAAVVALSWRACACRRTQRCNAAVLRAPAAAGGVCRARKAASFLAWRMRDVAAAGGASAATRVASCWAWRVRDVAAAGGASAATRVALCWAWRVRDVAAAGGASAATRVASCWAWRVRNSAGEARGLPTVSLQLHTACRQSLHGIVAMEEGAGEAPAWRSVAAK